MKLVKLMVEFQCVNLKSFMFSIVQCHHFPISHALRLCLCNYFTGRALFTFVTPQTLWSYSFSAHWLWRTPCLAPIQVSMLLAHLLDWHSLVLKFYPVFWPTANKLWWWQPDPPTCPFQHGQVDSIPVCQPPVHIFLLLPKHLCPSPSTVLFLASQEEHDRTELFSKILFKISA